MLTKLKANIDYKNLKSLIKLDVRTDNFKDFDYSVNKLFDNKNEIFGLGKIEIEKNKLKEVIIATSATVEGQTTAHYIEDEIKNSEIKISKLGQGLPVGGEIEQLDDGTLVSAFKNRVPVSSE